ncbi:immunity protein Imm33 domain-containing protein [Rhizobium terrae]|uniref:immunity protein Imm33 domain-containing protein n=1 Tax=Rhizobium terrae TaxID=2171756 RepID=UPI0013C31BB2|nr:hypothetical protein [Rhizobium terrae]
MMDEIQREFCKSHGIGFLPPEADSILGVSLNVKTDILPINGLRHLPSRGTSGWYIWAGDDFSPEDDSFFQPLHYSHISMWNPLVIKYLALPPGWRFLTDGSYEDIWFDKELLIE